jgi:hypothetical protein
MGWIEWIVAGLLGLICWRWVSNRKGNLRFWQLVAKHPHLAFIFFKVEKCWFIDEVPKDVAAANLVGPFRVFIPSVGRLVTLWGLHPDYLESEDRFAEGLRRNPLYGFLGR